jgi:hypothetical protein
MFFAAAPHLFLKIFSGESPKTKTPLIESGVHIC